MPRRRESGRNKLVGHFGNFVRQASRAHQDVGPQEGPVRLVEFVGRPLAGRSCRIGSERTSVRGGRARRTLAQRIGQSFQLGNKLPLVRQELFRFIPLAE